MNTPTTITSLNGKWAKRSVTAALAAILWAYTGTAVAQAPGSAFGTRTVLFPEVRVVEPVLSNDVSVPTQLSVNGLPVPLKKPLDGEPAFVVEEVIPEERTQLTLLPFHTPDREAALRFLTEASDHSVTFSIPNPNDVKQASLFTSFLNSADVLSSRSRLSFMLNGEPIGDVRLAAVTGHAAIAADLPTGLLRESDNILTIAAIQAHRADCTLNGTYDLWTEIDIPSTGIVLDYGEDLPEIGTIDLDIWKQSAIFSGKPVTMLFPPNMGDDIQLTQAAYIAQGIGSRLHDTQREITVATYGRPTGEPVGADPFIGFDIEAMDRGLYVLAGTRSRIEPLLGTSLSNRIVGPHLALHQLGPHPEKAVLVISGTDDQDVLEAALNFAGLDDSLRIGDLFFTSGATPRPVISAGRPYTFRELGHVSSAFDGVRYLESIDFQLPADLFPRHQQEATISLNYGYGADLGQDAQLLLTLNGDPVGAFDLDDPDGELVSDRAIRLPMASFRPGRNELAVEARLPRHETEALCPPPLSVDRERDEVGDLRFVLLDDSTIEFSDFSRLHTLPNLHLAASAGYPYASNDQDIVDVYVASPEAGPVSAMLTMVAQLRKRSADGFDLFASYRFPASGSRDTIIVGDVRRLNADALDGAPIARDRLIATLTEPAFTDIDPQQQSPDEQQVTPDPVPLPAEEIPPQASDGAFFVSSADNETLRRWLESRQGSGQPTTTVTTSDGDESPFLRQLEQLASFAAFASNGEAEIVLPAEATGVMMQYQSPQAPGKTWTTVTAASPMAFVSVAQDLANSKLWDDLDHQTVFFDAGVGQTWHLPARENYYVTSGRLDFPTLMLVAGNWLSGSALILSAVIFVTLVLFGWLTHSLLARSGRDANEL